MEPEVALMVTADVPAGVDGTKTSLELEQPATKPAEIRRIPSRPSSRRWRCCVPEDRRLREVKNAPKGRRRAAVIPAVAPPRRVWGRSSAAFFTVAMVRVVVAGALAVTANDP